MFERGKRETWKTSPTVMTERILGIYSYVPGTIPPSFIWVKMINPLHVAVAIWESIPLFLIFSVNLFLISLCVSWKYYHRYFIQFLFFFPECVHHQIFLYFNHDILIIRYFYKTLILKLIVCFIKGKKRNSSKVTHAHAHIRTNKETNERKD